MDKLLIKAMIGINYMVNLKFFQKLTKNTSVISYVTANPAYIINI